MFHKYMLAYMSLQKVHSQPKPYLLRLRCLTVHACLKINDNDYENSDDDNDDDYNNHEDDDGCLSFSFLSVVFILSTSSQIHFLAQVLYTVYTRRVHFLLL